jgi:hypothetical protein
MRNHIWAYANRQGLNAACLYEDPEGDAFSTDCLYADIHAGSSATHGSSSP